MRGGKARKNRRSPDPPTPAPSPPAIPPPLFDPPGDFSATCRRYRWQISGVCLLLVALTCLAFGRAAGYGFVDLDDPAEIYANPHVKDGFVPGSIAWAFQTTQPFYWEPLASLSHMLDCQIFGLKAGGHHLVSIGIQACTAL